MPSISSRSAVPFMHQPPIRQASNAQTARPAPALEKSSPLSTSGRKYAQQSTPTRLPQPKDTEQANAIIERRLSQADAPAQCKSRSESFSNLLSQKWNRFFGSSSPPLTAGESSHIRALMNQYSVGFSDRDRGDALKGVDSLDHNENDFVEVSFTDLNQFDQHLSNTLKAATNANSQLGLSPESIKQTELALNALAPKGDDLADTLPQLATADRTPARKNDLTELQNQIQIIRADLVTHQDFNAAYSQGNVSVDQGEAVLASAGDQALSPGQVDTIKGCLTTAQQKLDQITQLDLNPQGNTLKPAKLAELKARIDKLQAGLDQKSPAATVSTLKEAMDSHNEVREQEQADATAAAEAEKTEQNNAVDELQEAALGLVSDAVPELTALSDAAQDITGLASEVGAKTFKPVTDLAAEVIAEITPAKEQIFEGLKLLSDSSQDVQAQGSLLIKQGLEQLQAQTGMIASVEGSSLVLSHGSKAEGDYQELTLSQKDSQLVVKQGDFLIQQSGKDQLTITHGDETGDHQQFNVTPEKITLTVVQGDSQTQGDISGNRRAGRASASTTLSNIGGTDWGMKAGASISWERKDQRLDDGRTKHVRSLGGQASVGAAGAGITASIGGGASVNTIYLRSPRAGELSKGAAPELSPPTLEMTQAKPAETLAMSGDTVIYSRNFNLNASVGYQDPTGFHVEASASYKNEMRIGIQRLDGDPPLFRMRVEPETTQANVDLSGGWGPFSVGVGAGKAAAVFYEFDLSEAKVSEILETRTLPVMPNPQKYLGEEGKPISQEAFMAFNAISGDGVKLVEFGASESIEGHGSVSAKVATARISLESYQNLTIRENHASLESGRSLTISNSVWFRGEQARQSDRLHITSTHFTADNQIEQRYDGLRASYKISDTQTSESAVKERLTETNLLLGRSPEHSLQLPSRGTDFAQTEISVAVEIKPEHIGKLAALKIEGEPHNDTLNIRAVAYCTGIEASELLNLIESIQPNQIEIKQGKNLTPGMLAKTQMSKEQMLCKLQGEILGEFIDSHKLQSIAALDRLLGGTIVSCNNASNVYDQQLTAIGADSFKPSLEKDKAWDDFGQIATRQQQLAGLKQDLEGSGSILSSEAKTSLLQKIDDQSQAMQTDLNTLLADPTRRQTVISALVNGSSNGKVMTAVRNAIADKIGAVDHHLHLASNEELGRYINQVFSATTAAHTDDKGGILSQTAYRQELSKHINQILKIDDPNMATLALGLFKAADQEGALAEILAGVKDKRMPQLVANLSDQQKQELAQLVAGANDSKHQSVNAALSKDQLSIKASVQALDQELTGLTQAMAREFKVGSEIDPGKLMDLYKPAMRNQREFHKFAQKVLDDPKLPQPEKARLLSACELNIAILDSRLDQSQLSKPQQTSLLKGLMNPALFDYVGQSSHALLDGLIGHSKADAAQLTDYIQPLLKDTGRTGKQLKQILSTLSQDHPDQLAAALAKIPLESLTQMVQPSLSTRLTSQLAGSRDSLVKNISDQLSSQLSFAAGTLSDQALQAVVGQVDGLDLAALKTEIQAQYTELMPESVRQGLEEERDQWITAHAQEHIGQVVDKALARFQSESVISPDDMLQLVMHAQVGSTSPAENKQLATQAEALRQLNASYQQLSKALAQVQALTTKASRTNYTSLGSEIRKLKTEREDAKKIIAIRQTTGETYSSGSSLSPEMAVYGMLDMSAVDDQYRSEQVKTAGRTDAQIEKLALLNILHSASGQNLAYFKATAQVFAQFEDLQGRLAGAKLQQELNQNHSQPLESALEEMRPQLRKVNENLARLSPAERQIMLKALVDSPGFIRFQSDDGSQKLVKELVKLAEKDGSLTDLKDILFKDPQKHAESLLTTLISLDQSSQSKIFETLSKDKVKALATGLSIRGKNELIGLVREAVANDAGLAPKLTSLLNQNPDYKTAIAEMEETTAAFKTLPNQPRFHSQDVTQIVPGVVTRLKEDFALLAQLQAVQTRLNGLEAVYREPQLTEITAQIDLLKANTSLACADHNKNKGLEKQTALVAALLKDGLGTRSNLILNHLIDSVPDPQDLAKVTQTLFKADPDQTEKLAQPILRVLGTVNESNRTLMLQALLASRTRVMNTSSFESLAEKTNPTQFHQLRGWVKELDESSSSNQMRLILTELSKKRGTSF